MALKKSYRLEDLILFLTILFTFSYPFLVTAFILLREEEKKQEALAVFRKALELLTSNCKANLGKLLLLSDSVRPEEFLPLCEKLEGEKPMGDRFEVFGEGGLYEVKLRKGILRLAGVWKGESFKILYAEYVERH